MKLSSLFSTMKFPRKSLSSFLPLFLFFLILFSNLNLQISFAAIVNSPTNPGFVFNAANPDKLMNCRLVPSDRTKNTWSCETFDTNNPTIGGNKQTVLDNNGKKTCIPSEEMKDGECVKKEVSNSCLSITSGLNLSACLSWLADIIIGNIFWLINQILSYVLGFATWLLDIVVYATVVKFRSNISDLNLRVEGSASVNNPITGTNYSSGTQGIGFGSALFGSGKEDLIYYLWGILRDVVNLLLLITIIYYAVKTMLDGFGDHKDKFIYLLLFSIVINFSLFFVKFAIDISNILTLQAYTLTVNPTGFDSWDNFRKRAKDNPPQPATIGEYLINVSNMGQVFSADPQKAAAEERIIKGMQNSWVFQGGLIIMNLCLIYLVFFLIGMLVMRTIAFFMAMILAALLAADIFFGVVKGGKDIEFATSISEYTKNIKGDFYEALVKGPLLFLFLFLTGVLANAIFTNGIAAQVTGLAQESGEFKILGTAFGASLAVLLKFAVFFALAKVILDKINKLNIGRGEKSPMNRFGKTLGNFAMRNTAGRLAGGAGWVGRNTIGKGLTAWNDGRIKKLEANTKKYDEKIKNGGVLSRNWAKGMQTWNDRSLRKVSERNEKGFLTSGSYDSRGILKGDGRIAKGVKALGLTGDELGDATTKGFAAEKKRKDDEIAKRDKDRQARIDKVEEDNFDENSDEFKKKVKEIKVDFGGGRYSQAEIEDFKSRYDDGTASLSIGGKNLGRAELDKLFTRKDGEFSNSELAKFAIEAEQEKIKSKMISDKQKLRAQKEKKRLAQTDTEEGTKAKTELGRDYSENQEKTKKKNAQAVEALRTIDSNLKQTREELLRAGKVAKNKDKYETLVDEIDAAIRGIDVVRDNSAMLTKVDVFKKDVDLQERIIVIKNNATDELASFYDQTDVSNKPFFDGLKKTKSDMELEVEAIETRIGSRTGALSKLEGKVGGRAIPRAQALQDQINADRKELRDKKAELTEMDGALKLGRQRVEAVAAKAKSTETIIQANFREAKPEEKKP